MSRHGGFALDFSIVLPAYNEAPNVAPMLAALHEVLVRSVL